MNEARKIVVIIQARIGSTRLPGKVLLPLGKTSVLERVISQAKQAKNVNEVIVATTSESSDDPLCQYVRERGIHLYRGSEHDVLDRYFHCAMEAKATDVVRVTSDCPFVDPEVLDRSVSIYLDGQFDYVSNVEPPTFPDGLDVEVFSFAALERSWKEAHLPSEREHVTQYMRKNPDLFRKQNVRHTENLEAHRWTLDTREDYEFLSAVAERLQDDKTPIRLQSVLIAIGQLALENSSTASVNLHIKRDEGLRKSLEEDKKNKVDP